MDRYEEGSTHPQTRPGSSAPPTRARITPSSSPEMHARDIRTPSQGSVEGRTSLGLHPVHTVPGSSPAHPNLQQHINTNAPRHSLLSAPTTNESPVDEQSSTLGLLPQIHVPKRRYTPPVGDMPETAVPRGVEPVMLRPPSMRTARPVSEGYYVEREVPMPVFPGPAEHGRRTNSWGEKQSFGLAEATVRERLQPTLEHAQAELLVYKSRARKTSMIVNVAIGAQVLFGALTTGISAATTGRQSSIATSILGGLSTMAASYLAKARGSGEPEASSARCRELQQFERDCEAFMLDHGSSTSSVFDDRIARFRRRFEEIMGNDPSDGIGDTPDPIKGYADRRKATHALPV